MEISEHHVRTAPLETQPDEIGWITLRHETLGLIIMMTRRHTFHFISVSAAVVVLVGADHL